MGRAIAGNKCIAGFSIGEAQKNRWHSIVGPGYCTGCGVGPLHAALPKTGSLCKGKCSYVRLDALYCRQCTIAIDVFLQYMSKLLKPHENEDIQQAIITYKKGQELVTSSSNRLLPQDRDLPRVRPTETCS